MNAKPDQNSHSSYFLITLHNNIMQIKTLIKNGQQILSSFGCYFDYSAIMEIFGNSRKKRTRRKR